MDNALENCASPQFDPQTLLREEVQILSRRVEALIKWTEEFEDRTIFFGKSDSKEKSPSPKSDGMECPWGESSPCNNEGAEAELALEASDVDMFGASSTFADWGEKEPIKAEPAPAPAFSLLTWD